MQSVPLRGLIITNGLSFGVQLCKMHMVPLHVLGRDCCEMWRPDLLYVLPVRIEWEPRVNVTMFDEAPQHVKLSWVPRCMDGKVSCLVTATQRSLSLWLLLSFHFIIFLSTETYIKCVCCTCVTHPLITFCHPKKLDADFYSLFSMLLKSFLSVCVRAYVFFVARVTYDLCPAPGTV